MHKRMIVLRLYILGVFMNYSGGFVIVRKQDILHQNNDTHVQHSLKYDFKKLAALQLPIHDINGTVNNRNMETMLADYIDNSILFFSANNISDNTSDEFENFDDKGKLSTTNFYLNENILGQNQSELKAGEVFYIFNDKFLHSDGNLTSPVLESPHVIEITIEDELNRTSGKIPNFPLVPNCTVGFSNCTKCKEVSPYCHYMYSEERCVYFSHAHASKLYECGLRWFVVDRHIAFYSTLTLVIVISSALFGYMVWLRLGITYEDGEVIDDNVDTMRSVVQLIRNKRMPQSTEDKTSSDSIDSESKSQ